MNITLLGAAKGVTGSKILVQHGSLSLLLDAGMYQGEDEMEKLNKQPIMPAAELKKLSAIILTHGHLDHCGLVPKLVADGFDGPIYASDDTADLARLLWQDTLNIEEDLLHHQRTYQYEHVQRAKKLLKVVKQEHSVSLGEGLEFKYYPNGHILGSQSILLSHMGVRKLLFSSDLGRGHRYMQFERALPPGAECIILESTYGDRSHEQRPALEQLHQLLSKHGGKNIVMASFAIDRLQELLLLLLEYRQAHSLPHSVFIDSPMGIKSTDIYLNSNAISGKIKHQLELARRSFRWIEFSSQRKDFEKHTGPAIVLASSGMLEGGRVRSYLSTMIEDPNAVLVLTGFQAPATLGAQLLSGAKEVTFNGVTHNVKMTVEELRGLSAHADDQGLLEWVRKLPEQPKQLILNHGGENSQRVLRDKLKKQLPAGCTVSTSYDQQQFTIA